MQSTQPVSSHPPVDEEGGWLRSTGSNNSNKNKPAGRPIVRGLGVQIIYALIDICCVFLNGVIAFYLRFSHVEVNHLLGAEHFTALPKQPLDGYGGILLVYVALIVLFCQTKDLYRTPRTRTAEGEFVAIVQAVSLATLILTTFIYLSGIKIVSRLVVLISLLLNILLLTAWRYAKRQVVIGRAERGIGARNVAIIGAGRVGQALARQIEEDKLLGYQFKGFLDENHSSDPRLLGKIEELSRVARVEFLDEIFITIPSERELVKRVALEARQYRLDVKIVPDLYDGVAWNATLGHIGDFPVMDLYWTPIPRLGLFLKRLYDIILAALGLILTAPFLMVAAIWIKLDSRGPVFYSSERVGKKGRVFKCHKLRTMVINADELKDSLRHRNEREGPFFKINHDPRITHPGKLLRRYSLDELPQLWNVIKGDMSLVGPRPHPLDDYEQYDLGHLRRLEVKPGITGLWQVTARRDPSFETNMRLDLEYIESWNVILDLKITMRTFLTVLKGDGA